MRVAVVQLSSQGDVACNLRQIKGWVRQAAEEGARLVALPENFALMGNAEEQTRIAEVLDGTVYGPILTQLADFAVASQIYILAGGMPEKSIERACYYNTSVLIGPTGEVEGKYRKLHLFDAVLKEGSRYEESRLFSPGPVDEQDLAPVLVDGVSVGMAICYDLRFPELFRLWTSRGARLIIVPAAFTLETGKAHWQVLLRARAIENQVYIMAPAQFGLHGEGRRTYGKSLIIDPWGDRVAQCSEEEGIAVATLCWDYQEYVRERIPCLAHRRLL
ncbi:hypothetical protein BCY86_05425 [Pajaroellobacter abortibovis]|uniref:CN hydrolase domain-containing protein n=2 Tax=Pajaroellobacter abortibovis TaxID=1882918 RepID=A0A1L6MZF5_9BACT|nr:hypothetical protein BCY86_05425 [Pajaroellobacter abortibovis]